MDDPLFRYVDVDDTLIPEAAIDGRFPMSSPTLPEHRRGSSYAIEKKAFAEPFISGAILTDPSDRIPVRRRIRDMSLLLLIILVLLLVGALPMWPHSSKWGYYPGGGLGLVLLIVIVLVITGRI